MIYVSGENFRIQSYSGSGDVTADVTAVDLDLGLGNTSTSGCEAEDTLDFPEGDIALTQRGACAFRTKAETAGDVADTLGNEPSLESNRTAAQSVSSAAHDRDGVLE